MNEHPNEPSCSPWQYRGARISFFGIASLMILWLIIHREGSPPPVLRPLIIDPLAQRLGHPSFLGIRQYERNLPQHLPPSLLPNETNSPRYLFFPRATWGSGWNNVLQEQLLNTHLAYIAQRAYIFPEYIARDHPPFPDKDKDGIRHWLKIPINAFIAGPTAGGSLANNDSDNVLRRAVSEEWWNVVCPPEKVVTIRLHDAMKEMGLNEKSDGQEMMGRWAETLLEMSAPCVSIEDGTPFDFSFIGSSRVLSIWPSYGNSPTLKYFAWSPLITASLFHNFHVLSPHGAPESLGPIGSPPYGFQSFRPYSSSATPITGLLGIHVRRGDFVRHCANLADAGMDYNAWNLLGMRSHTTQPLDDGIWPALPDILDVPDGKTRRDAAFDHCWPSPGAIVSRVHDVRANAVAGGAFPPQDLRRVYIATDGDQGWIAGLAAELKADGWDVSGSYDMELSTEEKAVAQAVDMSVLVAAETFIGVGFSSLSSNVVQIRLAGGRDPQTIHFW